MKLLGYIFGALAFGLLAVIAIGITCAIVRVLFGPANDDGEEFTDDDWDALEDEQEATECVICDGTRVNPVCGCCPCATCDDAG